MISSNSRHNNVLAFTFTLIFFPSHSRIYFKHSFRAKSLYNIKFNYVRFCNVCSICHSFSFFPISPRLLLFHFAHSGSFSHCFILACIWEWNKRRDTSAYMNSPFFTSKCFNHWKLHFMNEWMNDCRIGFSKIVKGVHKFYMCECVLA